MNADAIEEQINSQGALWSVQTVIPELSVQLEGFRTSLAAINVTNFKQQVRFTTKVPRDI